MSTGDGVFPFILSPKKLEGLPRALPIYDKNVFDFRQRNPLQYSISGCPIQIYEKSRLNSVHPWSPVAEDIIERI
jgi:hypothetical protein